MSDFEGDDGFDPSQARPGETFLGNATGACARRLLRDLGLRTVRIGGEALGRPAGWVSLFAAKEEVDARIAENRLIFQESGFSWPPGAKA